MCYYRVRQKTAESGIGVRNLNRAMIYYDFELEYHFRNVFVFIPLECSSKLDVFAHAPFTFKL